MFWIPWEGHGRGQLLFTDKGRKQCRHCHRRWPRFVQKKRTVRDPATGLWDNIYRKKSAGLLKSATAHLFFSYLNLGIWYDPGGSETTLVTDMIHTGGKWCGAGGRSYGTGGRWYSPGGRWYATAGRWNGAGGRLGEEVWCVRGRSRRGGASGIRVSLNGERAKRLSTPHGLVRG